MTHPQSPAPVSTPVAAIPERGRPRLDYAASIYLALLFLLLTVLGLYFIYRLRFLVILLFLSLLLACGIATPVRWLERRRLPRSLAILTCYTVIFGIFAAITWYVLPQLVGQAVSLVEDVPLRIEQARQVQARIDELAIEYPIVRDLDRQLITVTQGLSATLTRMLLNAPQAIAKALFSLATMFTVGFLLLMTKERLLIVTLSLFHPRHRAPAQQVLDEIGIRLGAYLRAKLIVMVIVGALIWLTLTLLDSPYAILIAIFAGSMEAIPRVGPWIGRFAILLAVFPLGWQEAAIAMAAHVVIENFKGFILSPLVEADQVDIHPLTAFIAIIAGGLLLGWIGALIAVPAAAVVQVVVQDVLIPWRHSRLAEAERLFAIGPVPPDAELAHINQS